MSIINDIENGKLGEDQMFELASSNNFEEALAVAMSKFTTPIVLKVCALDADKRIRIATIQNPNVLMGTLEKLLNDKDAEVAQIAKDVIARRKNDLVL